ncbi:MAG: M48 family metalloprotease [Desulfatiglans sp.]|nr:M48 family metalloprotease [Desulfatiglans sp.]
MPPKRIKNRFYITLLVALSTLIQISTINALTLAEEEKKGEEFALAIKQQLEVVNDPFIDHYINDLGNYLLQSVETRHFKYRFYAVKNEEINAFAGPGGHIVVNTGLIRVMDEIDELTAVMCHEIAHVSNRHISQQYDQSTKLTAASMLGMLAGILVGGEASGAVMMGSMAAVQQKQLAYSRDAERQADQAGFKYALEAGFDPAAIKRVHKKLQAGHWGVNEVPAYLLTHPIGPERIANIESILKNPYVVVSKKEGQVFRELYPIFRTVIMAKYEQREEMTNYFSFELAKNPESPLANLGMGIILKEKGEYKGSITHLEKAVKTLTDPAPAISYLSEAYQSNGDTDKAVSILKEAINKNADDKISLLTLTTIYENAGDFDKTIDIYERLKLLKPVEDYVFYSLGYSYGKINRLGHAHYNFGLFHEQSKNIREAYFHYMEAKREAGDDLDLMKKIDESISRIDEEYKKLKKKDNSFFQPGNR